MYSWVWEKFLSCVKGCVDTVVDHIRQIPVGLGSLTSGCILTSDLQHCNLRLPSNTLLTQWLELHNARRLKEESSPIGMYNIHLHPSISSHRVYHASTHSYLKQMPHWEPVLCSPPHSVSNSAFHRLIHA